MADTSQAPEAEPAPAPPSEPKQLELPSSQALLRGDAGARVALETTPVSAG